MLTDWLIYLDLLEEQNNNTSFLRLVTPIIFGIFETHYYNYIFGDGCNNGNGNGSGYGFGYGYGAGDGIGNDDGNNYNYLNSYNEEH